MRVGVIFVYVDYNRKGAHHRGVLQPQIGQLIAALLPPEVEVEIISDTWEEPDWSRDYDLLFISCAHSDFDRARQVSHYWRRRGAKTVFGGIFASTYSHLCAPFFDAVVVGDAEGAVPQIYEDFCRGELRSLYVSTAYDAARVPVPRFDLAARKQMAPIAIEATRGCPFACDFCALTSIGTRFHLRPPELVARDIREGQRMLKGIVSDVHRHLVLFSDNNIGGNLTHLAALCKAFEEFTIRWGSAITFNVLTDRAVLKTLARVGCRALFVGLESFNPETIREMRKHQNAVDETRRVLLQCRDEGILIISGLLLSPLTDDTDYIQTIPARLQDCGLHVPAFIAFESPIPGTPYFRRLAAQETPALMPSTLLRDYTGYELVVRPKRESAEDFIEAYKWVLRATSGKGAKLKKLVHDLPTLLRNGHWETAIVDIIHQYSVASSPPHPDRTYLPGPGNDVEPPEMHSVPLTDADFDSEEEYRAIMEPWSVTDETGRVLPQWLSPVKVFEAGGRISAQSRSLATV